MSGTSTNTLPNPETGTSPPPSFWSGWGRGLAERALALVLMFLLLRSAWAHLGNPYHFLSSVYAYEQTSIETGRWVAITFPFLEMVLGMCLLARWWIREAYMSSFLLFSLFVVVQSLTLQRGLKIPCGCFGASASVQVGAATLAIAGMGAAFALVGFFLVRPGYQIAGKGT